MAEIYTFGYSDLKNVDNLIKQLKERGINILVDIRSVPYSRAYPDFNLEKLSNTLSKHGIKYINDQRLGGENIKKMVESGINSIDDLLKSKPIKDGIENLKKLATQHDKIGIMCSEKSPLDCHRFLAVGSLLDKDKNITVKNVVGGKDYSMDEVWKNFSSSKQIPKDKEKQLIEELKRVYLKNKQNPDQQTKQVQQQNPEKQKQQAVKKLIDTFCNL